MFSGSEGEIVELSTLSWKCTLKGNRIGEAKRFNLGWKPVQKKKSEFEIGLPLSSKLHTVKNVFLAEAEAVTFSVLTLRHEKKD